MNVLEQNLWSECHDSHEKSTSGIEIIMKKRWFEMTLLVPVLWTEILPAFLQEKGFSGLWIDSEKDPPHRAVVRAYLPEKIWTSSLGKQIERYLKGLSVLLPVESQRPQMQENIIEEEDWASSWLPFFEPLKFGSVWIRPKAKPVVLADGEQEIVIDPGQAFGTGHHETTELCLESILRLENSLDHGASVLDLGTGSGILAMFAATVGFTNILALDIDPVAVEIAQKNVSANKLQPFVHVDSRPLVSVQTRFDLTLANLSASAFVIVCEQVTSHIKKGGWLVASGILADEVKGLIGLFADMGLDLVDTVIKKEWACIILQKPVVSGQ
jgi:ribosomal protein L11 methyltransferase